MTAMFEWTNYTLLLWRCTPRKKTSSLQLLFHRLVCNQHILMRTTWRVGSLDFQPFVIPVRELLFPSVSQRLYFHKSSLDRKLGSQYAVPTIGVGSHVSNEKREPGCLGYIGNYTTQFCGDYDKPLWGSLLNNQDSMESKGPVFFFSWLTLCPRLTQGFDYHPLLVCWFRPQTDTLIHMEKWELTSRWRRPRVHRISPCSLKKCDQGWCLCLQYKCSCLQCIFAELMWSLAIETRQFF